LETIRIYRNKQVVDYLWKIGERLKKGVQGIVRELDLGKYFTVCGHPCCLIFNTNDKNRKPSQTFRTLFLQETIRQGLLMPSLIVSYAHTEEDVEFTLLGIKEALTIYKKALAEGIEYYLDGESVKPVFRKHN